MQRLRDPAPLIPLGCHSDAGTWTQSSLDLPALDVTVTLTLGSMTTASSLRVMLPPTHTHATQWSTLKGASQGDSSKGLSHSVPHTHQDHIQGLPHAYPTHIPTDQEVKGLSSQGHSDYVAVTRTTRGPGAGKALLPCFHVAWCCCVPPFPT